MADAPEVRAKKLCSTLASEEVRRNKLVDAKAKIRAPLNHSETRDQPSTTKTAKRPKSGKPKLVGKLIKHKWENAEGCVWYDGEVLEAMGDEYDSDCEFRVKYNDGEFQVKLLSDYKKSRVVVSGIKRKRTRQS